MGVGSLRGEHPAVQCGAVGWGEGRHGSGIRRWVREGVERSPGRSASRGHRDPLPRLSSVSPGPGRRSVYCVSRPASRVVVAALIGPRPRLSSARFLGLACHRMALGEGGGETAALVRAGGAGAAEDVGVGFGSTPLAPAPSGNGASPISEDDTKWRPGRPSPFRARSPAACGLRLGRPPLALAQALPRGQAERLKGASAKLGWKNRLSLGRVVSAVEVLCWWGELAARTSRRAAPLGASDPC